MEKDNQIFGIRAIIEAINAKKEIDKVKLKKKAMIGADGEIILGDNFTVIDKVIVEDVKKLSISLKKEGEKDEEYEVID